MKPNIHPQVHEINVVCACGNTFKTISTQAAVTIDICSQCHPFFTGKNKLMDTEGRIERFKKKYENAALAVQAAKKKKN